MKVAMICGFAWKPKATVSARAFPIAQELARRGHEVTLLLSPYDNLEESGKRYEDDGVRVINLEVRSRRLRDLLSVPGDFFGMVRQLNADLVHIYKPKGLSGTAGALLELLSDYPVVVDCDDWEGRGGWNDVLDHPWWARAYIDWQEQTIPRWAHSVTVASRLLLHRFGDKIASDRLFYVPNGPKPSLIALPDLTLAEKAAVKASLGLPDRPLVLYAGHMSPADEPEQVLNAFAQVVAEKSETWLLLIGQGPRTQSLRNLVQQMGLDQICFVGWLDYPRYLRCVCAADVVFYPFPDTLIYRAKCSGKIVEFMSLGKAIVTTAVGQNVEYLEHGKSGLLVPPRDSQSAAAALLQLLNSPNLCGQIAHGAREQISTKFSWGVLGETIEAAYERALRS